MTEPSFWIDVEDAGGNKYGAGPIVSGMKWQQVYRLNKAGSFSAEIPLIDLKSGTIQPRRILRCFTKIGNSVVEIGSGIADKIEKKIGRDGSFLSTSGDDLFRELTYRSVAFLGIDEPTDGKIGLTNISAFFPPRWSYDTLNGYNSTEQNIYALFAGETCLNALVKIAERVGENFRIGSNRKIVWLRNDQPASGIRAIQTTNIDPIRVEENIQACLIRSLTEVKDSYDLFTRIYPFGTGNGRDRLDLFFSTLTLPVEYTIDRVLNYIENNAAVANPDLGVIEKYASFKDIGPISNSEVDLENASNYLAFAAFEDLRRAIAPNKSYNIDVVKLDTIVYPGQTIRVVYFEEEDGVTLIDIDQDLIVLESTIEIDANGVRTSKLQVGTIDRTPKNDLDILSGQMSEGRVFEAHPQMNVSYYNEGFGSKNMSALFPAQISFTIGGDEVTKLNRCLLRFETDIFETTVSSVGGESGSTPPNEGGGSTPSGGGSTTPSGGGGTTPSGSLGGHEHSTDGNPGVTGTTIWAHVHETPTHEHQTPPHTHTTPNHTHTVTANISTVFGISRNTGQYPGPIFLSVNGTDRTSVLGGPWGSATTSTGNVEVDITSWVNIHGAVNTLEFSCPSGSPTPQGRIISNTRSFVTVQAILLS